jgi:hypothetical protein
MIAGADLDRGFVGRAYHVYRLSDGAIVLSHTFVRQAGGHHDPAAIERELLADAGHSSRLSPSELGVVSRDARQPITGRIVRVDPQTRELVTTQEPWPELRASNVRFGRE